MNTTNTPDKFDLVEEFLRVIARNAFDKFGKCIKWRADGKDVLVDIGCGPATILKDVIIPQMASFGTSQVYGLDISKLMIEACSKKFSETPNLKFVEANVLELDKFAENYEPADVALCFMVLHSIKDLNKALKSIRTVLKPNGQFLFTLFGNNDQFELYKIMVKDPKWGPFLGNLFDFVLPFYDSKHPDQDFKDALELAGFKDIQIDIRPNCIEYANIEDLTDYLKTAQLKLGTIPSDRYDEYLDDFAKIGVESGLIQVNEQTGQVTLKHNLITAFGCNQ